MKRSITILLIAIISLTAPIGCSSIAKQKRDQKRRQKQLERTVEKRELEEYEKYREAREHQVEIQSKNTVREMKRNQRKSMRYNTNKREFFVVRWFKNRSHRKARPQGGIRR